MIDGIINLILGIIIVMIGLSNINGNINLIHSYHRQRVTEENKAVFGRKMGVGTIVCGVGVILFGAFSMIASITKQSVYITIGSYLTAISLAIGVFILISTTIKYNKGIF